MNYDNTNAEKLPFPCCEDDSPDSLDTEGLCSENHPSHEDRVRTAAERLPDDEHLNRMAELFRLLGDPTRVRILSILSLQELCVCDLSKLLPGTQSAVSHQLRLLRQARLVRSRREGKSIFYTLDDDHVRLLFSQALLHINER